jgi:hypothetical protein
MYKRMDRQVVAGLKKIPTYGEVVRFIETDPVKIKMPNRVAELRRWDFRLTQYDNWMEHKTQDEVIRQAQFRQTEDNQPYARPEQRPLDGERPQEPGEYIDRINGQPPAPPPPPGPRDRANDILDALMALPPSAPYHPAPEDGMANALRAAGLPPVIVNPPQNLPQPLDVVDQRMPDDAWVPSPDAEMTQEDRENGFTLRRRDEAEEMQSGGGGYPPAPPGGGAIQRRGRI